jgi:hypothetical protein
VCVMVGGTPIYDQVRGERINADVPPSEADSWADYHGKHRLRLDIPVPAAVFGPPGPGADLAPHHHRRASTCPAGLPTADGQPETTMWGPRAALPPEAHTRQVPRHAASCRPSSVADHNPAARDTATGDPGAIPKGCSATGKAHRTSLCTPAGAQFSWFSAGHDIGD